MTDTSPIDHAMTDIYTHSQSDLTEFHKFGHLPFEMRLAISKAMIESKWGPYTFTADGKHVETVGAKEAGAAFPMARKMQLDKRSRTFDLTPSTAYSFLGVTPTSSDDYPDIPGRRSDIAFFDMPVGAYRSESQDTSDGTLRQETINAREDLRCAHQIRLPPFTLETGDNRYSAISAVHEVLRRVTEDRTRLAPSLTHFVLPPRRSFQLPDAGDEDGLLRTYNPAFNEQVYMQISRLLGLGPVKMIQDPDEPQMSDLHMSRDRVETVISDPAIKSRLTQAGDD